MSSAGASRDSQGLQRASIDATERAADAQLDFRSPQFDAGRALATPGLEPPDPSAQPLDYVAKCRVLLPPEMPESLASAAREAGTKTGAEVRGALALQSYTRHLGMRRLNVMVKARHSMGSR